MFTKRLKLLRKEAGLTQKDMANFFNISQPSYADWENGKTKPTQEKLPQLADILNTTTDYLLGKTNIKNVEEIDLIKLDEAIDNSIGFDGKPITPEDKESIREAILLYLESINK